MATSVVFPRVQFFANNGRPLIGGSLHTYVAGSSTRARTYKDAAKAQPNANPIILDARGEASVYLADGVEYKFVIEDSTGALIMTQEPVYGAIWPNADEWPSDATLSYKYMTEAKAAADTIGPIKFFDTKAQADAAIGTMANGDIIEVSQDETRAGARTRYKVQAGALGFVVNLDQVRVDLAAATGASLVGFSQTGTAMAARNAYEKLRERISIRDAFGIVDGDSEANAAANAAGIQALIDFAYSIGGADIEITPGVFVHNEFVLKSGVRLIGKGGTLKCSAGSKYSMRLAPGIDNVEVRGIVFDCAGLTVDAGESDSGTAIRSATSESSARNVRIIGNRFNGIPTGANTHAVLLTGTYAFVSQNYVSQCGGDVLNFNNGIYLVTENNVQNSPGDGGIAFNNGAKGVIANNYIFKCDLGIGAGPAGSDASPENTMTVIGNEIVACGDGINMGWYAYAGRHAPRNVKIAGNTIDRCKRSGIRYDGRESTWPAYMTITGNTVTNCGAMDYDGVAGTGRGIFIANAKYTTIGNNVLRDNVGIDIETNIFDNLIISGNAINAGPYTGGGVSGIECAGNGAIIANNVVFGRRIHAKNINIRVQGNTVQGVPGAAGSNQGGIVATHAATNAQIQANTLIDCGIGVYLQNLAAWVSSDLANNTFVGCTTNVYSSPFPRDGDAYVECYYTGTVDASNNFDIQHGFGSWAPYRVVQAQAFSKSASGAAEPLTLAFIDGSKVRFTGGTSGQVVRGHLRVNKDAPAW